MLGISRGCQRLLHNHYTLPRRCFQTVLDATSYHDQVSHDSHHKDSTNFPHWLAYLTDLTDVDVKTTVESMAEADASFALNLMLTQRFRHRSWTVLKGLIRDMMVNRNSDNLFVASLVHHAFKDTSLDKKYRNTNFHIQQQTETAEELNGYELKNNLERIVLAYYWLESMRMDFAKQCFAEVRLTDELECWLLVKALLLFPVHHHFITSVVKDVIRCEDLGLLAAKAALFSITNNQVVEVLLLQDKPSETITQFIKHLYRASKCYKTTLEVLSQLEIPENDLKQACLNLYHLNEDRLFYTTFLTLPRDPFRDLLPLISAQPLDSPLRRHLTHAVIAGLKLDLFEVISHAVNTITNPNFLKVQVDKDEFINQVLNSSQYSFRELDYDAVLDSTSTSLRAKIIKKFCGSTSKTIVSRIIRRSFKKEDLNEVLIKLLGSVGNLSASDYIDDCLILTCEDMAGEEILSLVRYLTDCALLSLQQQKFWMVVAYDRKEGGQEFVRELLEDVYNDRKIFFSSHDLKNLISFVSSEAAKEVLKCKLDFLQSEVARFEENAIQRKSTPRLLRGFTENVGLFAENNSFHQITTTFGYHSAVAALRTTTRLTKNGTEMVEIVRQLEAQNDPKNLARFYTYYGFLLPERIKNYTGRYLGSGRHVKREYLQLVWETQMYLYSYLQHLPLSGEILGTVRDTIKVADVAHVLLAYCVLYPAVAEAVLEVLKSDGTLVSCLSKKDKKLLHHLDHVCKNEIGDVPDQIGEVSESFSNVSDKIGEVSESFSNVSDKIGEVSESFGNVSDQIGEVSESFSNVSDV